MKIEVSNGEAVDKLTILEIKLARIRDEQKLINIRREYAMLNDTVSRIIDKSDELYSQLLKINQLLWDIEDRIRKLEKEKNFGTEFISLARSVYIQNDERARIKRKINDKTNSGLVEEKSYEDY
jgi:hypothetical protein